MVHWAALQGRGCTYHWTNTDHCCCSGYWQGVWDRVLVWWEREGYKIFSHKTAVQYYTVRGLINGVGWILGYWTVLYRFQFLLSTIISKTKINLSVFWKTHYHFFNQKQLNQRNKTILKSSSYCVSLKENSTIHFIILYSYNQIATMTSLKLYYFGKRSDQLSKWPNIEGQLN